MFWKTDKFLASFHHCFWYSFIYDYDSNFKFLYAFSLKYMLFVSCILNDSSFREVSASVAIWELTSPIQLHAF